MFLRILHVSQKENDVLTTENKKDELSAEEREETTSPGHVLVEPTAVRLTAAFD